MALKPIYLSEDEKKQLEFRSAHPSADMPSIRADIILLHCAGRSVKMIANDVKLNHVNVRKWIKRYRNGGIEGLRSGMSPGRPPLYSADQKTEFIRIWRTNPYAFGLRFKRWSLQRLRTYLIEKEMVEAISVETLRQIVGAKVEE